MVSDAKMIEGFHQKRSAFERIRQMAIEDDLGGSLERVIAESKTLSRERVAEYRRLIEKCGAASVVLEKGQNGQMRF
jgi:hypothetical protein